MLGRYSLGRTLGRGAYATVLYGVDPKSGEEVAIKVIDKALIDKHNMKQQFRNEVAVLRKLQHPRCVCLKNFMHSRTKYFLVLDYTDGSDVLDLVHERGRLDEPTAQRFTRQLLEGLNYCHAAGVCHRDIKPENLLVERCTGELRITDFGLATNPQRAAAQRRRKRLRAKVYGTAETQGCDGFGTPEYAPPELLEATSFRKPDLFAADVWSVAASVYVMLAGVLPFPQATCQAKINAMKSATRGGLTFPSWVSRSARDFMLSVFRKPSKRPTVAELLKHPWLNQPQPTLAAPPAVASRVVSLAQPQEALPVDGSKGIEAPGARTPPSRERSRQSLATTSGGSGSPTSAWSGRLAEPDEENGGFATPRSRRATSSGDASALRSSSTESTASESEHKRSHSHQTPHKLHRRARSWTHDSIGPELPIASAGSRGTLDSTKEPPAIESALPKSSRRPSARGSLAHVHLSLDKGRGRASSCPVMMATVPTRCDIAVPTELKVVVERVEAGVASMGAKCTRVSGDMFARARLILEFPDNPTRLQLRLWCLRAKVTAVAFEQLSAAPASMSPEFLAACQAATRLLAAH